MRSGNLANCSDLSPFANRRVILGTYDYLTPVVYVNPVVLIQLAGTGVGGVGYVWNLRMSANGIVPH